jgi:hypothetical protein
MLRVFALMASLLIAGCGPTTNNINNSNINKLQVGMKREEVIAIMGNPEKREVNGRTEFHMYTTGNFTLTPIAIDGRLLGWGRRYYDDEIKDNVTARHAVAISGCGQLSWFLSSRRPVHYAPPQTHRSRRNHGLTARDLGCAKTLESRCNLSVRSYDAGRSHAENRFFEMVPADRQNRALH